MCHSKNRKSDGETQKIHVEKIKKAPENLAASGAQDGDYLLSHLRSTIGVTKLNFSVRNGKRWNLRAIVT